MTNLDNWEREYEKRFADFPTSAWWFLQVKEFITTLLQAQRERDAEIVESFMTICQNAPEYMKCPEVITKNILTQNNDETNAI